MKRLAVCAAGVVSLAAIALIVYRSSRSTMPTPPDPSTQVDNDQFYNVLVQLDGRDLSSGLVELTAVPNQPIAIQVEFEVVPEAGIVQAVWGDFAIEIPNANAGIVREATTELEPPIAESGPTRLKLEIQSPDWSGEYEFRLHAMTSTRSEYTTIAAYPVHITIQGDE